MASKHTCVNIEKFNAELKTGIQALCSKIQALNNKSQSAVGEVSVRDWGIASVGKQIYKVEAQKAHVPCRDANALVDLPHEQETVQLEALKDFAEAIYSAIRAHCDGDHGIRVRLAVLDKAMPSGGYVMEANANWQLWGGGAVPNVYAEKPARIGRNCPPETNDSDDDEDTPW